MGREFRRMIKVDSAAGGGHTSTSTLSLPTVGVLMSVYNGERDLVSQLDSIANQVGVKICLLVRDDGSVDNSMSILQHYLHENSDRFYKVSVIQGRNVGYSRSFGFLLHEELECDYYAFSDQDDVWLPSKLISAISQIESISNSSLCVYASSVRNVSADLTELYINRFDNFVYSIESEFSRHRLAGHTMVFTKELHDYVADLPSPPPVTHDAFITMVCCLMGGELVLDNESHVLHRRLRTSVTAGGIGVWARIEKEVRQVMNSPLVIDRPALAGYFLKEMSGVISSHDADFLAAVASYRSSLPNRVLLLFNRKMSSGCWVMNLESRISIALGRY